ncbi:rhamnogalacturonan acetylesterase [Actomonas aquatica]|uniref:Rhamnogalacturonan acetylesterase n=1 Tax=Actomonas aquatica TaxID=2866162 RepID=A0ABZ1CE37_9BACT|nr:rhamnogalacturonan acetylesterase [Opitutus sp. WL0086]WRQ89951.1 rhamnogalacturonan acetylesterase [Opitutus sp. WL0086]
MRRFALACLTAATAATSLLFAAPTVDLPVSEGNHAVTLTFGAADHATSTTVWGESRQLLLENVTTAPGEFITRNIIVNTRTPALTPPEPHAPGATAVELNPREQGLARWDDRLTLTFAGDAPAALVDLVEDAPATTPALYLLGDSTVTDQQGGDYASWGQMMPRMFDGTIAVANHAESGETMKSFLFTNRLNKVLSTLRAGDTVLIQFGHNDSKSQWPQTYAEPHTTYPAYLRTFIAEIRLRGATPVLVTSPERRNFTADGHIKLTHGDYPQAVREVASAEEVALIDLNRTSITLYEALGPQLAPLAFANSGKDGTHHNAYGAYQLALAIAHGLQAAGLPIADHLAADLPAFDPAHPTLPADFPLTLPDITPVEAPRGN